MLVLSLSLYGAYLHYLHLTEAQNALIAQHNTKAAAAYGGNLANHAANAQFFAVISYAITASVLFAGFIDMVVLRLLGMFRLGAIVRVTYYEALLQPFTLIVLGIGLGAIIICAFVPFNTFGEDTKLYRDVAMSFVLMFALVPMVFATGKVVDEEIENRTMLTLMSKPIARWQVIVGKYLGVVCLVLLLMTVMTLCASAGAYLRYFDDKRVDFQVAASAKETMALFWSNDKGLLALWPAMALEFMEVCTLAAISMAIATRFAMALNMTAIVLLYIGANMTRFVPLLHLGNPWQPLANAGSYVLPFLSNFDLNQALIYRQFTVGSEYIKGAPSYGQIWGYVGFASLYGLLYIGIGLSLAIAMFRTRELT